MSAVPQSYEVVPVTKLVEHPKNPRVGDVEAIVAAITANGWHGALLVQRSTAHVLAGNHRLRAAKQLGMETVPVIWADVDDDEALAILVSDNRASDFGYFDEDALVDLLRGQSPDSLAGMLFSEADLAMMSGGTDDGVVALSDVDPAEGGEPADLPEVPSTVQLNANAQDHEGYLATQSRSVVLPFPLPTYVTVTDHLRQLRQARSIGTNAELVATLAAEAVATLEP